MIIAGTLPIKGLDLVRGKPRLEGNKLILNNLEIPISMGTSTLIASAIKTLEYFGENELEVITAGDIGEGDGSLKIYNELKEVNDDLLVIHYIKPKISKIREIDFSPKIIADAGGMYAAKAANIGDKFFLFLPDVGELSFLADEKAYHPAYVRGFISEVDDREVPKLIERAYKNVKMPKYLVVKGEKDYVVSEGKIIKTIEEPKIEAMECIGGTGDSLTGIISSLISLNFKPEEACILGCKVNRVLGEISEVKPDTKIETLIKNIPKALKILKI
ncbi:conserved hypothetical protein [Methanocaldococcus infernus ME]|uniref:YjeF C-terminal domain-containing protein n=1 Tax=Methanocaldococcus infernus (strain DSM 11812 / JCM 15783 / ME) TaxID=573063 RepID=D5VTH7_METIM|nr:NAD(P)H-hydrate dehydratase [Methanocaldococcus infernus]ADG13880.1 conserved hypothetical protein [Methanocaldococcus infernus ME]